MPMLRRYPTRRSKRLKDDGKIAGGTKSQVDLVPVHSVLWLYFVDALHATIDPIYNTSIKREINKNAAAIPPATWQSRREGPKKRTYRAPPMMFGVRK
jgi:hypothetical protein